MHCLSSCLVPDWSEGKWAIQVFGEDLSGEPHCFIPLIGPFVQGIKANAKQLPHRHSMALICGLLSFVPFIAINYLYIQLFFYLCRCPVPVALCLLPMILNRVGEQSAIAVCFCCLFVAILFLFFALLPLLPPNEWLSWPGPIKCARLTAWLDNWPAGWLSGWPAGGGPNARCTLQLRHKSNLINWG